VNQTTFHLSLGVANLERSQEFYERMLDQEPSKSKPDYAKFELSDPPLSLAIQSHETKPETPFHLGFRLPSTAVLERHRERIASVGLRPLSDDGVCCYADQRKFWVVDPDGYKWEFYVLLRDSATRNGPQDDN